MNAPIASTKQDRVAIGINFGTSWFVFVRWFFFVRIVAVQGGFIEQTVGGCVAIEVVETGRTQRCSE